MNKNLEELMFYDTVEFVNYVRQFQANSECVLIQIKHKSIPVFQFKKGFFTYANVLPHSLYSPIKTKEEAVQFLSELKKRNYNSIAIHFPPQLEITEDEVLKLSKQFNYKLKTSFCHILSSKTSLEEIVSNFNDTRKKHINRYIKAQKVRIFQTNERKYFEKYYDLYVDSSKRWGKSETSYSKTFISNLGELSGVKIWVAEVEGNMISGMICFYHKHHVFDWLAASIINDETKKLYAAVAVQYEVIKDAVEKNLDFVNMGASINLSGVSDFKDSWGAKEQKCFSFYKNTAFFKISKKLYSFKNKLVK